jgi:hypothetical protein
MKTVGIIMTALLLSAFPLWAGNSKGCKCDPCTCNPCKCAKTEKKCCCGNCSAPCTNENCKCPSCPNKK